MVILHRPIGCSNDLEPAEHSIVAISAAQLNVIPKIDDTKRGNFCNSYNYITK